MRHIYRGPFLHHARTCLRHGTEASAISWIMHDVDAEAGEWPQPGTLRETDGGIAYETVGAFHENLQGAGI